MLKIVIPIAGMGNRFLEAGYTEPKPLIKVNGIPMVELVIKNIKPKQEHKFIFICLKEHIKKHSLDKTLKEIEPDCKIISIESMTAGATCSVLLAKEFIDNKEPLMIANCDQLIDMDINDYLEKIDSDGFIMTMKADNPKWSYVKYIGNNVIEVVEKVVVSDQATVGIYNYARGKDFVKGAEAMILKDIRTNNEFYVAPVFNELIKEGKSVKFHSIGSLWDGMYGLGTPSDLKKYISMERK